MAKGGWNNNKDTDGRLGNDWNDRAYARQRDPRSEQETGSRYSEIQSQIQQGFPKDDDDAYHEGVNRGQNAVKFWPSVGKFIIPKTADGEVANTWEKHAEIVCNDDNGLFFNPEKYLFFDKIIAEKFGKKALFDPDHRDYAKYEGLRTNLEVLRNDIIGIYLRDGSFDPGDEVYVPCIQGIAETLGDALANDVWYKKLFTRPINVELANVEGVGAAEMYKYLLAVQSQPGMFQNLVANVRDLSGFPARNWNLPSLDDTPFSDANLTATSVLAEKAVVPEGDVLSQAVAISEKIGAKKHNAVETLGDADRKQSVVEAHTILRWLKNLQATDMDVQEWVGLGSPAQQIAKTEALGHLVDHFNTQLEQARKLNPLAVEGDATLAAASDAANALTLAVIEQTLTMLPLGHEAIARLEALSKTLPPEAEALQTQSVGRLIEAVELGLERASGQQVGTLSPLERLIEMSRRINSSAKKLRSVSELEQPRRREAIDEAHKILRGLQNLGFSDEPMEKTMSSGTLEEKAAFVQKIADMVDMYQNMLSEAVQVNPDILSDQRVKEANDAVGTFAYGFSLMAAKEIPGGASDMQRISAEVETMPEQWKNLSAHTVAKLAKTMEAGMESMDEAIAQQRQQQQSQDEELATKMEASSEHTDRMNGKKRRRRSTKSGKGSNLVMAAKRRNAGDLNGDGVADSMQGLNLGGNSNQIKVSSKPLLGDGKLQKTGNTPENIEAAFMQGLNAKDMEAVKKLGGDLKKLNKEMKDVNTSIGGDKIMPDNKNFALRNTEREGVQKPKGL